MGHNWKKDAFRILYPQTHTFAIRIPIRGWDLEMKLYKSDLETFETVPFRRKEKTIVMFKEIRFCTFSITH